MAEGVMYVVTSSNRLLRFDLGARELTEFSREKPDWVPVPNEELETWEVDPREEGVMRSFSLESALNEWKTRSPVNK